MFPVHVFHPLDIHDVLSALRPKNQDSADDKCHCDGHWLKKILLDGLDEQQTQNRGGKKCNEKVQYKAVRILTRTDIRHDIPDFCTVFPAYRKDCTELDDDREYLAFFVIEIEQITYQDEVAGRGDRKKFGQTLHDAENQGLEEQKPVHVL